MRKRHHILHKILCVSIITSTLFPFYTLANSMPTYIWGGGSGNEALLLENDCPIEVKQEVLTFDIQEFPADYYESDVDFNDYSGEVTAEYTFYNPTDEKLIARLAFPFGNVPEYAPYNLEEDEYAAIKEKKIFVNGVPVEKTIRQTYSGYGDFDANEAREKLVDGYTEDSFYRPDLPVMKYIYKIEADVENSGNAEAILTVEDDKNTVVLAEGYLERWDSEKKEGAFQLNIVENQVEIYVLGEENAHSESPEHTEELSNDRFSKWTFRDWGEDKEVDGEAIFQKKEIMTFEEFALQDFPENEDGSKYDWYNAKVAYLRERESVDGIIEEYDVEDFPYMLMYWYEYEITLDAGESLVNKVTAPVYPSIDIAYEPPVYEYSYLLSPAKLWNDFGELEIVINTPFYMTDCTVNGFEKTEDGYRLTRDGLPPGDLEFKLSESENPKMDSDIIWYRASLLFYIIGIPVLIVGGIAGIFIWRYKVRKKKEE